VKRLLIDDCRDMDVDVIARTFDEGVKRLQECVWDELYLDHDLGEEIRGRSGTGICRWLLRNKQWRPKRVYLVTANPVGRDRMGVELTCMGYRPISNIHFELKETA
jgi:hypothetical protein